MAYQIKIIESPISTPDERRLACHNLQADRNEGWTVVCAWVKRGVRYVELERETPATSWIPTAGMFVAPEHPERVTSATPDTLRIDRASRGLLNEANDYIDIIERITEDFFPLTETAQLDVIHKAIQKIRNNIASIEHKARQDTPALPLRIMAMVHELREIEEGKYTYAVPDKMRAQLMGELYALVPRQEESDDDE
jgi:hypothetical protein